eukprot:Gregarina_sp_Poly_1__5179@NODE_2746_length_1762_cov_90_460177_g1716_i1_p1_GENE_NODE_2746_length_1762_cov_90_460177_g1716_i1NODE_2746_length_1762_cov_90_460177_g1716_i1_p1_ORF_typecomplete_len536_score75_81UDPGP/PF01704_18/1_6e84IspD/PF01128_19/0_056NTP_transf_3/PF12804_7/0_091_NODE_2746_length_1762_cov_90_460177_g1716_i111608
MPRSGPKSLPKKSHSFSVSLRRLEMSGVREQLLKWKQGEIVDYIDRNPDVGEKLLDQFGAMGVDRIFEDFRRSMARDRELKKTASASYNKKAFFPPKFIKTSEFEWSTTDDLKQQLREVDVAGSPAVLLRKSEMPQAVQQQFFEEGLRMMREGELCCILMAGGQGSRLKFDGPKGCYQLKGLPTEPTIFEVLLRRLAALKQLAGARSIPLYIMVSIHNGNATKKHLEEHNYFGLPKEDVILFEQTLMPSFSESGQALLESPDSVSRNPNGNGGLFESLKLSGKLADMKTRGVKLAHVVGVDNVLVKICDPLFVGMVSCSGAPVGNKCVAKAYPTERVGVQAFSSETLPDGRIIHRPCVVEYTEISPEQSQQRVNPEDPNSDLLFSAANICNHLFTLEHIENVLKNPEFEYHVAIKNLKSFDPVKNCPTTLTGVKLEYFIFDAFVSAKCVFALEADRNEEFSPVKNFEGVDSPQTAVQALIAAHHRWLEAAGVELDAPKCQIELGATYQGEGLEILEGKKATESSPLVSTSHWISR